MTAVVPYLCYARKDRQTKARDPITTRYVAQLFEALGTDRVITMEAHNIAAFQNAFRCDSEHLDANALFADHFQRLAGDSAADNRFPRYGRDEAGRAVAGAAGAHGEAAGRHGIHGEAPEFRQGHRRALRRRGGRPAPSSSSTT